MRELTIGKNDAGQRLDRFVSKSPRRGAWRGNPQSPPSAAPAPFSREPRSCHALGAVGIFFILGLFAIPGLFA